MKKYRRLTRADRIAIEKLLAQEKTQSEIAERLGFNRSSISREIRRNKALHSPYRWRGAQAKANSAKVHPVVGYRRKIEGPLEELVIEFLEERLSPDQISQRLKLESAKWSVSHETIYKWIYKVAPAYKKCLRWKSRLRQKRSGKLRRSLHKLPRRPIDKRPEAANLRSEAGHWERDLLEGRRGGPALLVIQDRKTRMTITTKVNSKHADVVNAATLSALKGQVVRSVTNDNGIEFGKYNQLEILLNAPVYFCHAFCSWERGTVENTNGLLRQYFPKGIEFKDVTDDQIKAVAMKINSRPRKKLGYKSPLEVHEKKTIKLIRPESFYRTQAGLRELSSFKQCMIREVGFYLDKK